MEDAKGGERECTGPLTCAASSPSFACTIKQAERNGDGPADQERSLNRSRRAMPDRGVRGGGALLFLAPAPPHSPHRGHGPTPSPKRQGKRIGDQASGALAQLPLLGPPPRTLPRGAAELAGFLLLLLFFPFPFFRPCRRISRPASDRSHRLNLRTRTDTPLAAAESTRPNGGAWAREEGGNGQ